MHAAISISNQKLHCVLFKAYTLIVEVFGSLSGCSIDYTAMF